MAVDASDCVGAVHLQLGSDGVEHLALGYSTVEKEALPLVMAGRYYEVYLGSASDFVTVYTDHSTLVCIDRMRNPHNKLYVGVLYSSGIPY